MKKKFLVILVVGAMILVAACSNKNVESTNNQEVAEEEEEAEAESEVDEIQEWLNETKWIAEEAGITVPAPQSYLDNNDKVFIFWAGYELANGLVEFYATLYPGEYNNLNEMSDDDFYLLEDYWLDVIDIYGIDENWTEDSLREYLGDDGIIELTLLKTDEELGYTYYYIPVNECPDGLEEACGPDVKNAYDAIIAELPAVMENTTFTDPIPYEYETAPSGTGIAFTTEDLDGNSVTSGEIFSENEITMVNIWASWCTPCIEEMPELEKLSKELDDMGCGLVGVLLDGDEDAGLADGKEIIADIGVTYLNVKAWDDLRDVIPIQVVPTTYFVDGSGAILGEPIMGADINGYMDRVKELLGEG